MVGASVGGFGVAWFGHLGGFAAGLGITLLAYRRIRAANPLLDYVHEGAEVARYLRQQPRRHR